MVKTKRREFLQSAVTLAGGILLVGSKNSSFKTEDISDLIKIEEPFHGAILNHRHGEKVNDGLKIMVQGEAPLSSNVTINGIPAKRAGTKFTSEIVLREKETEIIAADEGWFGQNRHNIKVVWDKNSFPRYGFEVDDNIFFLRDIARKNYDSLFDCFYLKGLKDLNRKYGTKFLLNIYYTDGLEYSNREEFDLSHFPDRYKSEWQDNADWLRLTFHAYSNKPDRPYQYTSPEKLINDLNKVQKQIYRFAGEETYTPPTIIHWGMIQPSSYKSLAGQGVRLLRGHFKKSGNGSWDINNNLDDVRSEYLSRHDSLKDFDSGIIFAKVDMVCNSTPIDQIVPGLESTAQDTNQAENIDLMTHEQYFWPFYKNFIPDHFKRLDKAINWVTEHGYKPVFWNEEFMVT